MANGTVAPVAVQQFFDNNGDPLSGAKLYTYAAGTLTPLAVYSNSSLTTPLANPAVADSAGRLAFYLSPVSYKFILKTSADVTVWTQDNVAAVPFVQVDLDVQGVAGETLTAGNAVYLSDGSGGLNAGQWYKTDSDNTYSSTTAKSLGMIPADITSGATGSIRLQGRLTGLAGLSAGSIYYISATAGGITTTPPANARAIAVADSTTSVILAYALGIVDASATVSGIVNLSAQVLGAGAKTLPAASNFYAGTTTTPAQLVGTINVNTTSTSNTGAAAQDLLTYSLPANTLAVNGQRVHVIAWGSFSADTDAKLVAAKFGSTTISAIQFSGDAALVNWRMEFEVVRTGAATQLMTALGLVSRTTGSTGISTASSASANASPTETLSGAVLVGIRVDGDNTGNITQLGLIVEVSA